MKNIVSEESPEGTARHAGQLLDPAEGFNREHLKAVCYFFYVIFHLEITLAAQKNPALTAYILLLSHFCTGKAVTHTSIIPYQNEVPL